MRREPVALAMIALDQCVEFARSEGPKELRLQVQVDDADLPGLKQV